jgi:hypothetical protein
MERFIPFVAELAGDEEGRKLLAMVLDDTYHEVQNKPPELPPIGTDVQPKMADRRGGGRKGRGRR